MGEFPRGNYSRHITHSASGVLLVLVCLLIKEGLPNMNFVSPNPPRQKLTDSTTFLLWSINTVYSTGSEKSSEFWIIETLPWLSFSNRALKKKRRKPEPGSSFPRILQYASDLICLNFLSKGLGTFKPSLRIYNDGYLFWDVHISADLQKNANR
jgi:hypothetical protein